MLVGRLYVCAAQSDDSVVECVFQARYCLYQRNQLDLEDLLGVEQRLGREVAGQLLVVKISEPKQALAVLVLIRQVARAILVSEKKLFEFPQVHSFLLFGLVNHDDAVVVAELHQHAVDIDIHDHSIPNLLQIHEGVLCACQRFRKPVLQGH